MTIQQTIRDTIAYNHGYFQGRSLSLTDNLWSMYGTVLSKATSMISIPLPLLSFAALPFFGSTSTTINLAFFWLVWTTFVWRYDPWEVEIYGTIAIRLLFFLLPSYGLLAFDAFVPSLSANMKADGEKQLPHRNVEQRRLARIVGVATFNTLLAIAVQAVIEFLLTEFVHFRSGLRVSTFIPPPWSILKDVLRAIVIRGFLHYAVHRYVLHASARSSPLARWHRDWAHSIRYPFSLAAAYDHPVCYLLAQWLPVYLPALLFRYHVLTWHILVAITSLEELFIHSGYAVLPTSILLSGMARRTDRHYATKGQGNFGHWGVLDWVFGTTCAGEADVMDDLKDEAEKQNVKERVSDTKKNAKGLMSDAKDRFGDSNKQAEEQADEDEPEQGPESPSQGKRRSKRRPRKASAAA